MTGTKLPFSRFHLKPGSTQLVALIAATEDQIISDDLRVEEGNKLRVKIRTDKKLVIAGGVSDSASYAEQLKALAGENGNILFTDFVQGRMLEELYSNAYVYVLPSDLEGMPLSLLEAMSYGNCCVTSDIPECAQVIADHGVAFPKADVAALAAALQQLCDDAERTARYKKQTSDFVCGKYNWDDVTTKTLELYQ